VRLGAGVMGDAIASYDRSVAGLESGSSREAHPEIHGDARGRGLRSWAVSWLAERLRVDEARIDARRSFADHGVDSLAAVEFAKALADRVGVTLDETLLWNFPTIESLLSYLERPQESREGAVSAKPAAARADSPHAAQDERQPEGTSNLDAELARLELELKKRR